MIIDSRTLDSQSSIESDICILGGGVAGIVLANELKHLNKKIVIIEGGDEIISQESQNLYLGDSTNKFFPSPEYSRLRMLGGSSNHWENNTSPLDETDFEVRDWVPNSGWPIKYRDLEKFYPKAAEYCGTESDGYNSVFWSTKLNSNMLTMSSKFLDAGVAKSSSPPVRFFSSYGKELLGRDNVTIYKNANIVDIEFNQESESVEKAYFETDPGERYTVASKIFVMCFGGIENARMLLHFNKKYSNQLGNAHDNVGRYFMDHPVVRAGHLFPETRTKFSFYEGHVLKKNQDATERRAIHGYLKLTESVLKKYKLNNLRIPLVPNTRYVMSDGISSSHILSDSLSNGEFPDDFSTHVVNILSDIGMVFEGVSRKKFDKSLFDSADEFYAYQLPVMLEQTPDRNNRIKLGEKKDRYGIEKIIIDWELNAADKQNMWKVLEIVAQEIGAQSLGRVHLLKERSDRLWGSQLGFGHHHMGTTRMSEDYKQGVVDKNHLVYGTKNMFIGGSSVFPTGGHVPPTLTIAAMCIRLAKVISKEYLL